MDDKETLIRVEQQLQDSIKNQSLILSDLKELFNKIDTESKSISSVKSDLSSFIDMSTVRREEVNRRLKFLDDRQKEAYVFSRSELEKTKADLEQEKKKRVEDINDGKIFQKQITVSITIIKWIIGFLFLVISTVWPIVTFLLDKKP